MSLVKPFLENLCKVSCAGLGSLAGSYVAPILSECVGPKISCSILLPVVLLSSYLLLAYASNLAMVVIGRIVMGVGMGMSRTLCPSYIEDVVHPRNGWLKTCLPYAMTAAGILLGQVGTL